jgi:hypothetical protein
MQGQKPQNRRNCQKQHRTKPKDLKITQTPTAKKTQMDKNRKIRGIAKSNIGRNQKN